MAFNNSVVSLISLLLPPRFHPPLKLLPASGRILPDSVLAQEPVHPDPLWTVLGRGQVPPQTVPRISQQALLRLQQAGARRV